MVILREYDTVRVTRLLVPERAYDGTRGVMRAPRVGDVATICHEHLPSDPDGPVAVEMVDENGMTIWLADFSKKELALVCRP